MPSGLRVNIKKLEVKKIKELAAKGARILVGVPSGMTHEHKGKTMDMAELAEIQSVGTATIPARPYLEEGILSRKEEIRSEIKKQAKNLVENGQANYDKVGTKAVGAIQEFVRGDYYKTNVPNAPSTIRQKSKNGNVSDVPLIDTAELLNSTRYVVLDNNGSGEVKGGN